jgi:hypothetical protein
MTSVYCSDSVFTFSQLSETQFFKTSSTLYLTFTCQTDLNFALMRIHLAIWSLSPLNNPCNDIQYESVMENINPWDCKDPKSLLACKTLSPCC